MTLEELKRLMRMQPFRPYTVHLADGRSIAVRHSEFVAISPTNRTFIVYQPDGDYEVIDTMLVTSLGVGINGQTKRKGRRKAG